MPAPNGRPARGCCGSEWKSVSWWRCCPNSLRFCFDVCARGTPVEGADLEIVETPGRALCEACGCSVDLATPFGRCVCGGSLRIVAGEELRVKDMEVE